MSVNIGDGLLRTAVVLRDRERATDEKTTLLSARAAELRATRRANILTLSEFANSNEAATNMGFPVEGFIRGMMASGLVAVITIAGLASVGITPGFAILAVGSAGIMLLGAAIGTKFPTDGDLKTELVNAYEGYLERIKKHSKSRNNDMQVMAPVTPNVNSNSKSINIDR